MSLPAVLLLAGVLAAGSVTGGVAQPSTGPCDGPDGNPWVSALRDRVLAYNGLARYAVERHGTALTCEGAVTAEFDGNQFGMVRLRFAGDVTLTVETMPPEASVVMLRSVSGFEDADAVRHALRDYVSGAGIAVDWTTPEETEENGERVLTFWDPTPGLNGSASLIYRGDVLVAIRFSMAL